MSSTAGASTYSKSPNRFPSEYPKIAKQAFGCTITDENDTPYTDYTSSLGAITLGYNRLEVNEAVKAQIDKGNIFSLVSDIEPIAGDYITEYTDTEKCMFLKTGTDSTNAAVKLSRAFTNNDKILFCSNGYHGWGNWFGASQPINKGVPSTCANNIYPFDYDNLDSLEEALTLYHPGTVIMEPIVSTHPSTKNYLKEVIKLVHDYNALFIADEMVTFPRFSEDLFTKMMGAEADLYCIGKGISNGYSISAVLGREDILEQRENEEVFISGTYFGETIGMVAMMETLNIIKKERVPTQIAKKGRILQDEFNSLCHERSLPLFLDGLPQRQQFQYINSSSFYTTNELKSLFLQEMSHRNQLFGNVVFVNGAHTNRVLDDTLEACGNALDTLEYAIDAGVVREGIIGKPCQGIGVRK